MMMTISAAAAVDAAASRSLLSSLTVTSVTDAVGHAFLGTTNLDLTSLTERFQTRFQSVRLQPAENEVLAAFLARRWGAPIAITRQIADGARGNGRAAMADLEM